MSVRFVRNRYCARVWGENGPEWPPSPYRLLRGIIAACKFNEPNIGDDTLANILSPLLGRLPHMMLPVPYHVCGNCVGVRRPVDVWWPGIFFDDVQIQTLCTILRHLRYLGRTESWCVVNVGSYDGHANCLPLYESDGRLDHRILQILVPQEGAVLEGLYTVHDGIRRAEGTIPEGARYVPYVVASECLL